MRETKSGRGNPVELVLASQAPLGEMVVLDALTGRDGTNRSRGHRQIDAETDQDAVLAWLARFVDSPNTLASSRREAERLLLWSVVERGKPLSSLTHEDLLIYRRFLANPQPAARWVMPPGRKLARRDPAWRPFAGPLADASIRQSMVILNSLMGWLVEAGYLSGNPLALAKRRRKAAAPRVTRFLETDLWQAVRETIVAMPQETLRERAVYARSRWLFSLLFLAGLRISEVVGNDMGDFFMRTDATTGDPRWWVQVLGKGDKERLVPATTELMIELMKYRRALELSDLPSPGEPSPLLFPVAWRRSSHPAPAWPEAISRSAVHTIVKEVFAAAADRWEADGRGQVQADKLRAASTHWLRHTAASNLANGADLRHARDTLGHSSLTTTSIYIHGEDDARHSAISAVHRIGW
ncbi:tyrosine-type recombinase/integrase [Roseateles puraquae]|uniref:Integrase n=2 Tax=Roseateles puraquae TaxID=431059 RepID=A0A254MYP8_9BURK|nr:tyrosine-type recombinase/integrase [Roseateles puraquae]MDG0856993.1 integrase [Roseateles puraquae]OWR00543.1 integrase [Roseateles puraquae]RTL45294.1 MAG: integrase [Burkholderiales bacterium]